MLESFQLGSSNTALLVVDLQNDFCHSQGIENIPVTGVATDICVKSTAGQGYHRDYNVILIENCCGAYDNVEHAATLNNIRTNLKFPNTLSALWRKGIL